MRIFLAQQNYHIGNFELNAQKIIDAIQQAIEQKGDLIVFSELAICGYPPRDFLEFADFIDKCYETIERIKPLTQNIAVLVGSPSKNNTPKGKNLHNSAWFIHEGAVKAIVNKTLLPTYDVFDEYRYFEPANEWNVIDFKGKKLAVTICEDIWNLTEDPQYRITPMDELMHQQPDLMINLSASPFNYFQHENRMTIIKNNVRTYGLPMVYCNAVGSQTEIVFDGGSMVMDENEQVALELPAFQEGLVYCDLELGKEIKSKAEGTIDPLVQLATLDAERGIDKIYSALITGIKDYFGKMGFKKAIVASSGGIDSALVLTLACHALGAENVTALLMPSQFSTDHSVNDAVELSKNLNNEYHTLPIKDIFGAFETTLEPVFNGLPFNVAEENLQSRIRGALVMAMSNKFGTILLNTSNKSELATGYGTLYGDMAGGLGVLGDLYKVQVYALSRYINRNGVVIPQNIIDKAPSAELRPGQKDSDSLPDYEVLDAVLFQYIEKRKGPEEIIAMGFDAALVQRVLKLVNTNEYKRNQFCPIIRVSPKAFGIGRRVPIVGKYLS